MFEPGAIPALKVRRADEVLPPSLPVYGSSVWAWLVELFPLAVVPGAAC